jgi:hypothetical protein
MRFFPGFPLARDGDRREHRCGQWFGETRVIELTRRLFAKCTARWIASPWN